MRADDAGERLDRGVGDAEQDARGGAQHHAVVLDRAAHAWAHDQQAPMPNRPASKAIIAGSENCECAPCIAGQGQAEHHQAGRHQPQAQPLARADLEAEHAIGHHGDQDHTARQARPGRPTSAPAPTPLRAKPRKPSRRSCRARTSLRRRACGSSAADGAHLHWPPSWRLGTCRRSRGWPRKRRRARGVCLDRESWLGVGRSDPSAAGDGCFTALSRLRQITGAHLSAS